MPYLHETQLGLGRIKTFDSRPGIPPRPALKVQTAALGPHGALCGVVALGRLL